MHPLTDPAANWRDPHYQVAVVTHLLNAAHGDPAIDLDRLATIPLAVLESHPTISVRYVDDVGDSCGVFGYYRPTPPTITLQRSTTWGRDNFTVLHEYAHHLQQHDDAWIDVLWPVSQPLRGWIEEEMCNVLASNVLLPAAAVYARIGDGVPTARAVADLYATTPASRLAICTRVTSLAGQSNPVFVALTSLEGRVLFARSSNFDVIPQPPRDLVQADIARLIKGLTITAPSSAGLASRGVVYKSGATRHDIRLSVALDHQASYAFVVGSPESRYGLQQWSRTEHECTSAHCEEIFTVDSTVKTCTTCGSPPCPKCGNCSCEHQANAFCRNCFLALSVAESAAGNTLCSNCL